MHVSQQLFPVGLSKLYENGTQIQLVLVAPLKQDLITTRLSNMKSYKNPESRMVYLAIVRYKFAKTRQVDNSKHYDTKNTLTPW